MSATVVLERVSRPTIVPIELAVVPTSGREYEDGQAITYSSEEVEFQRSTSDVHRFLKILGSFFVHFITLGLSTSFGSYQAYYEEEYLPNSSSSTISWIGTTQVFLLSFLGLFSGAFYDRGYVREVLAAGLVLVVLGMGLLGSAREFWQVFLAQGLCVGLGSGLIYVPAISSVSNQFITHRTLALGVAASGAAAGGIIWPIAFRKLLPSIGFAWVNRSFAFLVLILAIASYLSLTSGNFPGHPDGQRPRTRGCFSILSQRPGNVNQNGSRTSVPTRERLTSLFSAFNGTAYLFLCVGVFFVLLGYWIPLFYIVPYASTVLNAPSAYAPYLLSILNAGSFFGRVVPASVGRFCGSANILLVGAASLAVLVFVWLNVQQIAGITVWCFFLGFVAGSVITIPNAVASRLSKPSNTGQRIGIMWTAGAFAELVGTPIAGTLVTQVNGKTNYLGGQLFGGLSIVIGAAFLIAPAWSIFKDDRTREARLE
ncbi:MFS general substrate transporter [Nemania abortiva]|nr:MFS general substrate transporter [Nemania abortiva]